MPVVDEYRHSKGWVASLQWPDRLYIWGPAPPKHPPEEALASVTAIPISPTDHQSPRPMQLEGLQAVGSCLKASTSTKVKASSAYEKLMCKQQAGVAETRAEKHRSWVVWSLDLGLWKVKWTGKFCWNLVSVGILLEFQVEFEYEVASFVMGAEGA